MQEPRLDLERHYCLIPVLREYQPLSHVAKHPVSDNS